MTLETAQGVIVLIFSAPIQKKLEKTTPLHFYEFAALSYSCLEEDDESKL